MSTGAIIGIVVAVVVVLVLVGLALWRRRTSGPRLRPLEPQAKAEFAERWARAQEHFVDRPAVALAEADRIISDVMTERGYPADADHDRREQDLGRGHRHEYRAAHTVLERSGDGGGASTEDMREAMVRYRAIFQELVGESRTPATH